MKIGVDFYVSNSNKNEVIWMLNTALARLASFDGEVDWGTLELKNWCQPIYLDQDGKLDTESASARDVYFQLHANAVPNNG